MPDHQPPASAAQRVFVCLFVSVRSCVSHCVRMCFCLCVCVYDGGVFEGQGLESLSFLPTKKKKNTVST